MGSNQTSFKQEVEAKIQSSVQNSCVDKTSCKAVREGGLIYAKGFGNTIKANQQCKVSTKCVIDSVMKTIQEQQIQMENMAKAGLLDFSKTNTDLKTITEANSSIKNKCGEASSEMIMKNVPAIAMGAFNKIELDQIGDTKSECYITAAMDTATKLDQASKQAASGFNPIDDIAKMISDIVSSPFVIIGGIVAVIVIIIIIAVVMSGGDTPTPPAGVAAATALPPAV
jgi:hypothetical protein